MVHVTVYCTLGADRGSLGQILLLSLSILFLMLLLMSTKGDPVEHLPKASVRPAVNAFRRHGCSKKATQNSMKHRGAPEEKCP